MPNSLCMGGHPEQGKGGICTVSSFWVPLTLPSPFSDVVILQSISYKKQKALVLPAPRTRVPSQVLDSASLAPQSSSVLRGEVGLSPWCSGGGASSQPAASTMHEVLAALKLRGEDGDVLHSLWRLEALRHSLSLVLQL